MNNDYPNFGELYDLLGGLSQGDFIVADKYNFDLLIDLAYDLAVYKSQKVYFLSLTQPKDTTDYYIKKPLAQLNENQKVVPFTVFYDYKDLDDYNFEENSVVIIDDIESLFINSKDEIQFEELYREIKSIAKKKSLTIIASMYLKFKNINGKELIINPVTLKKDYYLEIYADAIFSTELRKETFINREEQFEKELFFVKNKYDKFDNILYQWNGVRYIEIGKIRR